MRMTVYCFLGFEDVQRARELAATRNACKTHGVNHRWADRSDAEVHTIGALGECAVAFVLGVPVDETARPGGDDGRPDLILPDGKGVNVKTRIRSGYDFLLDPGQQDLGADYGVLCWTIGGPLTVEIAGYCTPDDVQQHARMKDFGHGPRLALPAMYLRPITGLIARYRGGDNGTGRG